MKKKGRKSYKKEDDSEEWCFFCKDGGELIICDHKDCLKSYHRECVQTSIRNAKRQFICDLHSCDACGRNSDIQCYCCPKGLCRRCIKTADFVHVRGKKGFCSHCLKLALLVEENKDIDSDGESVDFNNLETYETLYKEYWQLINANEKLTLEDLVSAKAQLKSGKNYDSDNYGDSDEETQSSDYENKHNEESQEPESERKRKRSKPQPSSTKGKTKSNKKEFNGWGSTHLVQFLAKIGKDPTHLLLQRELETIIKGYVKERKLLQKKRTVECDAWLQSLFGRKTVKLNKIYDLLESHLAENQASSDEAESGYDSEDNGNVNGDDDEKSAVCKRRKNNSVDKIVEKKVNIPRFHYAAVVPENIRLVYLRRTLVQKLEKERETFESKVTGSFVRVKEDANGYFPRGTYQLTQVSGIKKCLVGENDQNVVLQALNMDICINSLSDDDFSEEECQDLRNKVKSGLLKKLTLVELEQKAKSLHQDIVKHWIPRELTLLRHRIDQANEKGWRKELFEYLERRQFLQNPANQSKLLEKVPTVVPDVEESGPIEETGPIEDDQKDDKDSPISILMHTKSENLNAYEKKIIEERAPASGKYAMGGHLQKLPDTLAPNSKASIAKDPIANVEQGTAKSQPLIDLGDDDDDDGGDDTDKSTIDLRKEDLEDTENCQWYVMIPSGEKLGPVSLSVLKSWSKTRSASESKIYKETQTEEQAIPLIAVIDRAFPEDKALL